MIFWRQTPTRSDGSCGFSDRTWSKKLRKPRRQARAAYRPQAIRHCRQLRTAVEQNVTGHAAPTSGSTSRLWSEELARTASGRGSYSMDKLMMGNPRPHGKVGPAARYRKIRGDAGTVCSVSEVDARPVQEDGSWSGTPEKPNVSLWTCQRKFVLVQGQAYRPAITVFSAILLGTRFNLYGPRGQLRYEGIPCIRPSSRKTLSGLPSGRRSYDIVVWGGTVPPPASSIREDAAGGDRLATERFTTSQDPVIWDPPSR